MSSLAELFEGARAGVLSRRQVLRSAIALGLSAPVIASLLAACGGDDDDDESADESATEEQTEAESGATETEAASDETEAEETEAADETEAAGEETDDAAEETEAEGAETEAGSSETRGRDGRLSVLSWQAPLTLNPHLSTGGSNPTAARLTLEPLADFNVDGELVPILAAEIPSFENGDLASDGMSVTWRLKEGVTWSDGEPFTSKDVKFTYDYVIDPASSAETRGSYTNIASIETPDDYTVTITFTEPAPSWFNAFCSGSMILPEHILAEYVGETAQDAPFNLQPIGTGPFKVDEFQPGNAVVYSMNENYREPGKPYFETVEFKGGGDVTSAARAVVQTGEADYAFNLQLEVDLLNSLSGGDGVGEFVISPGVGPEQIVINFTDPRAEVDGERSSLSMPHPWQSDLKVRQAYNMAIQRETIVEQFYGPGGEVAVNVLNVPPAFASPNTSVEYDLDAAAALLDEAGWVVGGDGVREKDGVKMELVFVTAQNSIRQKTQELIKADFEKLGIRVELQALPSSVLFTAEAGIEDSYTHFYTDIMMYRTGPTTPYPIDYMVWWYGAEDNIPQKANGWVGRNVGRWQNAEFDKLYEQALVEIDPEVQAELFIGMNDLIVNDVAEIALVRRSNISAVAKDITGLDPTPWTADFWNVADWQRTSGS